MALSPKFIRISIIFLFSLAGRVNGQVSQLQSLVTQLKTAGSDHERAGLYYSISRYYWNVNADSALLMGKQSLLFAERSGDDTAVALAYLTMGVVYGGKGQYPQALDCHLKALRFSEKAGMQGLSGNNFTNIGIVYSGMGEYREAADYFRRSLDISLRDRSDSAHIGVATAYINLGDVFRQQGRDDSAVYYGRLALPIVSRLVDSGYLATTWCNLGTAFSQLGQTDSAIGYARRAREFFIRSSDSAGIEETDNTLAGAHRLQGKFMASIGLAQEALRLAEASHDLGQGLIACRVLDSNYEDLKDYKAATAILRKELMLHDSIFTLAKEKQVRTLQSGYELEKKQQEIALLAKENALQKSREGRNRDILLVLAVSSILLGVACALLYKGMLQKQRLNSLLQERNRKVIAQNEQLASLNAVKNKLFSIIGHDLRSPVATLKGFVSLLQASALAPDSIALFAAKMQDSLSATAHLLDNLLFWAKSQMEGMIVQLTVFDLLPLLEQNRQLAQPRADAKRVRVVLTIPPGLDAVPVIADSNMIDLVIRNLLENAIKFSYEGGTVTLGISTSGERIRVFVKDEGKGIPAAHQAKIQSGLASFTTIGTANEKGSGLGLFLCQELLQKNSGTFGFDSREGEGSTFYFTLPPGRSPVTTTF